MERQEWDAKSARQWVVWRCWEQHKESPGGIALFFSPENLKPQDPPFNLICEAVQYLKGEGKITAESVPVRGEKLPAYIHKLALTPQAIVKFQDRQDRLEERPRPPLGFNSEG